MGQLCQEHDLQRSAAKLEVMLQQLQDTGVTRFWA